MPVVGYDTVALRCPLPDVQPEALAERLTATRVHLDHRSGEVYSLTGQIENVRVNVRNTSISLTGSFAKLYHGNGFTPLTIENYTTALGQLSDLVGIDLRHATVSRVDVAADFQLEHSLYEVLNSLGNAPRYKRAHYPESVMYTQTAKSLILYDKIEERKQKRERIPPEFRAGNLLRYECQLKRSPKRLLKIPELQAWTLAEKDVFAHVVGFWRREFERIEVKQIVRPQSTPTTPSELQAMLMAYGVQTLEGSTIEQLIRTMPNRTYRSRVRKAICSLRESSFVESSEAACELTKAIQEAAEEAIDL